MDQSISLKIQRIKNQELLIYNAFQKYTIKTL